MMVKVAVVEEEFPQASVAVKTTVAEPVLPQRSDNPLKLFDQVTAEQSVADAPPLEFSQLLSCVKFVLELHSMVRFAADDTIAGGVISLML